MGCLSYIFPLFGEQLLRPQYTDDEQIEESLKTIYFHLRRHLPAFRILSLYCWSSFFILFWYSCNVPDFEI